MKKSGKKGNNRLTDQQEQLVLTVHPLDGTLAAGCCRELVPELVSPRDHLGIHVVTTKPALSRRRGWNRAPPPQSKEQSQERRRKGPKNLS